MTQHSALAGADLHEPKGIGTAANNTVYVANGAGSGAWTTSPVFANYTVTTAQFNLNKSYITLYMPNVAAGGTASGWVVCPRAGTITKIYVATQAAAAGADNTLTASIAGTPLTNGISTITVAGSAAGDVSSSTPSAANTVTAGQALKFVSSQAATGTLPVVITIELTASA